MSSAVPKSSIPPFSNLCGMCPLCKICLSRLGYVLLFTIFPTTAQPRSQDSRAVPASMPQLAKLCHLTIDTHTPPPVGGVTPNAMPQIWQFILLASRSWACPLSSIILRLSDKVTLSRSLLKDLLDGHSHTLKGLYLINCDLEPDGVKSVASRCKRLERLAIKITGNNTVCNLALYWNHDKPAQLTNLPQLSMAGALSQSQSLQIIHDVADTHTHGTALFLHRSDVQTLMESVPSLTKILSYGRCWTVSF